MQHSAYSGACAHKHECGQKATKTPHVKFMHRQGVVAWMLPGSHTLSPCPLALLTAKQWQHIHPSAISAETLASDSLRQQKLSGALTQHPLMHFSDLLILPQVPNDELTVLLAKPQLPLPLGQLHTQKAHCSKRLINKFMKENVFQRVTVVLWPTITQSAQERRHQKA